MLQILLLPQLFLADAITRQLTVRVHSGIVSAPGATWSKLWYLLRALDIQGSGFCRVNLGQVCQLLGTSASTVRQWLREGKAIGAFRWWKFSQKQGLQVALGGLYRVCFGLGLDHAGWGTVAEIPLTSIHQLRAIATGVIAQREQQLSRFAAWRSLPTQELRQSYRLPQPEEFFEWKTKRLSNTLPRGSIRCVIHLGAKRVFVSKGFIPFGASQPKIAYERSRSDRTVRRHLSQIGMDRRQICQAKAAYGMIQDAMFWDSPSIAPEPDISLRSARDGYILNEPCGRVGKLHSSIVSREKFFTYGDRHYIYRCNLHEPIYTLRSMRVSVLNYKALLKIGGSRWGGSVLKGS